MAATYLIEKLLPGIDTTKSFGSSVATIDFSGATTVALPGTTTLGSASVLTLPTITGGLTASGSVSNDFSGSTGTFKTSTGAATFGGSSNAFTAAITPTGGVAAAGGFAVSPRVFHTGGQPAMVSTDGTDTTVVTTETYISEVFIPANATITGVAVFNGSANAGNLQVSLANSSGVVISAAQTASTAQSGTDAYQRIPFAVAYAAVGPATYYVMVQGNNTGAKLNTHIFGNFNTQKQTGGTYGTFTTVTVAGTFTTAVGVMCSLY